MPRSTRPIGRIMRRRTRTYSSTRIRSRPYLLFICMLVFMLLVLQGTCSQRATYDDDDDDLVQQVLQEEEKHYSTQNHRFDTESDSEEAARLQAEAAAAAAEEEERIARERAEAEAELARMERELEFERELALMDREQQKAAKRQKKRDARIVRQVLNADRKKRLYAVLGLRNYDIHIGPVTLFRSDASAIRRAYRTRARTVHPDRNRDGRAQEAFIAVENAASILSDEELREKYDDEVREARRNRRDEMKRRAIVIKRIVSANVSRVIWVFRRIFGPFAAPIFILGCLMI